MRAGKATVEMVSRAILDYLARNPQAQDTVEGVVEWWLLDQTIVEQTALVKASLSELVKQGFLVELPGRDARNHYRVNRERLDEIRRVVSGDEDQFFSKEAFMTRKVRSRCRHLVTFELNTTDTIHLAPNEVSRELEDYETAGNPQLKKLLDGKYIVWLEEEEEASTETAKKKPSRSANK